MTVDELLDRMSARELAEWEAYFRLDSERVSGHTSDPAEIEETLMRWASGRPG